MGPTQNAYYNLVIEGIRLREAQMAYEQYHLDVVLLKESGSGKSKVAIRQAGGTLFELTGEHETPMAALLALAQKVNPHVQPPQEETLPSAAEQYRQANLPD